MPEHQDSRAVDCRGLGRRDIEAATRIAEDYVGTKPEEFREWWAARPEWFRGAFLQSELVGLCYGSERGAGRIVLQGIAVLGRYWRRGIGSRLIRDFESVVFGDGATQISLGAASDEPTERFYLKNGYRGQRLVLMAPREISLSLEFPTGAELVSVKESGGRKRLEIDVGTYSRDLKEELERTCSTGDGMYIFEKANPAI